VLGVRPEHIAIMPGAPLAGTVTLVEPMGNHQVVWIDAGGQQLSAIVHDNRALAVGEAVRFTIDAGRASLFDPDTEQRL
jgi:multiple sugar transport system ATP-binding protein